MIAPEGGGRAIPAIFSGVERPLPGFGYPAAMAPRMSRSRRKAPHVDPLETPEVEALTQQILQHEATANSGSVQARAEQGAALLAVKAEIPHGSWLTYLQKKVPFSRRTADRAIDLYHFREGHPAAFAKLHPIGLTKADLLLKLPVPQMVAFLSKPHPVPSAGATKTPSP